MLVSYHSSLGVWNVAKTLTSGFGGWSGSLVEEVVYYWWRNKILEEFEAILLIVFWVCGEL
jgi:hypothetical protein